MAILYATGWEAGSVNWYTQSSTGWAGNGSLSTATADQHRSSAGFGGNYAYIVDDSWACLPGTVVSGTARWLHFWMKPSWGAIAQLSVQFAKNNSAQTQVNFTLAGVIELTRYGSLLATAGGGFLPTVAHWIAIEMVCQTAGGIINVYVDNVLAASFTGNTQNAGSSGWDQWGFGSNWSYGYYNCGMAIDDVIVTDVTTGRLTEQHMLPITPDGDSTPLALTPSTGSTHFNLVNSIPLNDTTYNSASATEQADRYTFSNNATATTILGVNFCARAARDGSITHAQIDIEGMGGSIVSSPVVTLPASPTIMGFQFFQPTDPVTSAAWTQSGVNSLKAGVKFTT